MAAGSGVSAFALILKPARRKRARKARAKNDMSYSDCVPSIRHCERSEAIQKAKETGLLRRVAPRNDAERANYAIALLSFSATWSRKPVVESQRWSAPTRSARSLVMKPASTVSTQTFSSVEANFASSALLSSLARCDRPRVQAKIEAIELVEVSLPF